MMEYEGYFEAVRFDDEANIFRSKVVSLRDIAIFQGTGVGVL